MCALPTPQIEIDDDDQVDPGAWTPARGLLRGSLLTLLVGALLGAGWCILAWRRPDIVVTYHHEEASVPFILGAAGAIGVFLLMWILFATMHRSAMMVGGFCPVIVTLVMLLMLVAKQLSVAASPGVSIIDGELVKGAAWLMPQRMLTSNIGPLIGIVFGIYAFREGDSLLEFFSST